MTFSFSLEFKPDTKCPSLTCLLFKVKTNLMVFPGAIAVYGFVEGNMNTIPGLIDISFLAYVSYRVNISKFATG